MKRNFKVTLIRIWPLLLFASGTIWIGALFLTRINIFFLSALLGVVLIVYSLINLAGFRFIIEARNELLVGAILGCINGVITGMTGVSTGSTYADCGPVVSKIFQSEA